MNKQKQFMKFFAGLPSERTREFELATTDFAGQYCDPDSIRQITALLDSKQENVAYGAFYTLCIIQRRNKNFSQMSQLLDQYEGRFANHPSMGHLRVLFLIESDSIYDYNDLLTQSHANSLALGTNAGYVHAFADTFASICEKCEPVELQEFIDKWYAKALDAVNKAIELDPKYAKYYCTKARIVMLKHQYSEAVHLVKRAITEEDASRKDYALRISGYQYYQMYIQLHQQVYLLEQRLTAPAPQGSHGVPREIKDLPFSQEKPYAFVSYAHSDKELVIQTAQALTELDKNIWFDRKLTPGGDFWEELAERILGCNAVVLFLSGSSVDSAFVRRELKYALNQEKPIIAVHLDDVKLSPGMQLQLDGHHKIFLKDYSSPEALAQAICQGLTTWGV